MHPLMLIMMMVMVVAIMIMIIAVYEHSQCINWFCHLIILRSEDLEVLLCTY
jgi:hypothetical protein